VAKAKPDGIGSAIRGLVPPRHGGNAPWYMGVPDDVVQEVGQLHDDLCEGRLAGSETWLARAISSELRSRGICTVGYQGVLAWMKNRRAARAKG
jgi:hypothetical protein